jgi:hypothetical protein
LDICGQPYLRGEANEHDRTPPQRLNVDLSLLAID